MISFELTLMQLSERPEFFVLLFCLRKQRYKVQFVQVWGPQFITNSSLDKKSKNKYQNVETRGILCYLFIPWGHESFRKQFDDWWRPRVSKIPVTLVTVNFYQFLLNWSQNGDHELVRRSSGNDQNRPEVIYITPDNVDSVIQTLRLPSYRELRKRKRPFTIFVEGIVGTGKSTFLEPFQVNYS